MYYYDDYGYVSGGISVMGLVISLALLALSIVVTWRIFVKAGEKGWASLIPIYNVFVSYKIVWGSGWMMFLMLVPLVNVVFAIMSVFRLAKVFGKGVGFGFGLLFLAPIFMLLLAFGDARYVGIPGKSQGYYDHAVYHSGSSGQNGYQPPVDAAPGGQHNCAYCGGAVQDGTKFCPHCGAKQE